MSSPAVLIVALRVKKIKAGYFGQRGYSLAYSERTQISLTAYLIKADNHLIHNW